MSKYIMAGMRAPAHVRSSEDVRWWQNTVGVKVDGIWGKDTQAAYQNYMDRGQTEAKQRAAAASAARLNGRRPYTQKASASAGQVKIPTQQEMFSDFMSGQQPFYTAAQPYGASARNTVNWPYESGSTEKNAKQGFFSPMPAPKPWQQQDAKGFLDGGQKVIDAEFEMRSKPSFNEMGAKAQPGLTRYALGKAQLQYDRGLPISSDKAVEELTQQISAYMQEHKPVHTIGIPSTNKEIDTTQGQERRKPEYTGGLGGGTPNNIRATQEMMPSYSVSQEDKLTNYSMDGEGVRAYQMQNNEGIENYASVMEKYGIEAKDLREGPAYDYYQPQVKKLDAMLDDRYEQLKYYEQKMMHASTTVEAGNMVSKLKKEIKELEATRASLVYVLPDDVLRNEFGAKYADLLCLRTPNKEQKAQITLAIKDLQNIRRECYISGDYGRMGAAEDIWNALERKLPGYAAFFGATNNAGLGVPDLIVASGFAQNQGNDYMQFFANMSSADAVRDANPGYYNGAEFVVDGISTISGVANIVKTGGKVFGDKLYREIGKSDAFHFLGEMGYDLAKDYTQKEADKAMNEMSYNLYKK